MTFIDLFMLFANLRSTIAFLVSFISEWDIMMEEKRNIALFHAMSA